MEHNIENGGGFRGTDNVIVSGWSRGELIITRKFPVIDVLDGEVVEVNPDRYGQEQEQSHGVDHEHPSDAPADSIDRAKQCAHTLEE